MLYLLILLMEIIILFFLSQSLKKKIYLFLKKYIKRSRIVIYLYAFLFLPGTYFHELCHGIAAQLLFVEVRKLSLKPTFEENKLKLGTVEIAKVDAFRRTIIGIAPFFLGILTILLLIYLATSYNLLHPPLVILIIGYFIFQVGNSMFSSRIDLEEAWKVILIFFALVLSLYLLGIRVNLNLIFTREVTEAIKTADLYLAVPLIIDSIIWCLLYFVKL